MSLPFSGATLSMLSVPEVEGDLGVVKAYFVVSKVGLHSINTLVARRVYRLSRLVRRASHYFLGVAWPCLVFHLRFISLGLSVSWSVSRKLARQ